MLDESPDMPAIQVEKVWWCDFTATQTMEHVKEGRKLGPTPAGMLPQSVAEPPDRYGRNPATREVFDRFRRRDKTSSDLAADHLRLVGQKSDRG